MKYLQPRLVCQWRTCEEEEEEEEEGRHYRCAIAFLRTTLTLSAVQPGRLSGDEHKIFWQEWLTINNTIDLSFGGRRQSDDVGSSPGRWLTRRLSFLFTSPAVRFPAGGFVGSPFSSQVGSIPGRWLRRLFFLFTSRFDSRPVANS